jgi:hypothetical protein
VSLLAKANKGGGHDSGARKLTCLRGLLAMAVVVVVAAGPVSGGNHSGGVDDRSDALDVSYSSLRLDPVLARGLAGREREALPDIAVAQVEEVVRDQGGRAQDGSPGSAPAEGLSGAQDDAGGDSAGNGALWLMSHYTGGQNWGNTTYPYGSAVALPGEFARPGIVACSPDLLGARVEIAGLGFLCGDTGSMVGPRVGDIWCEEAPGSWGPTDPEYASEWWYGLPCPNPCEAEINGRCYATVRVLR